MTIDLFLGCYNGHDSASNAWQAMGYFDQGDSWKRVWSRTFFVRGIFAHGDSTGWKGGSSFLAVALCTYTYI